MELSLPAAPAAAALPVLALLAPGEMTPVTRPPSVDAIGEPFAQELAQWMGEAAVPASVATQVADAAGQISADVTAESLASEEPVADPAAMIWMILGLQKPDAPMLPGASVAVPPANADPAAQALPALPTYLRGHRPELLPPAQASARPDHASSGPVGPSLSASASASASASPMATCALATAFARHLESGPRGDAVGPPQGTVPDTLPASAAPAAGDLMTALPAPSALPAAAMIERVNSLTAGLNPTEVLDPLTPQAPQQVAETVVWHLGKGDQEVRIRMNPKDLGQIDVSIKLEGERVDVRFDAADASVRDVVQTSLPHLATLLSARGLTLDQAQVFSQSRGQQNPAAPEPERRASAEGSSEIGTVTQTRRVLRRGLVDDYV